MATLKDVLASRTREGELYHQLDNRWVHCYACGHNCKIPAGALGVCKVRFNEGGRLMVPWGYAGGVQCDPIEKKPFFHVHPGALAYSFGMLGCDLHCGYCQNWVTSQALRDPHAVAPPVDVTPTHLVEDAPVPRAAQPRAQRKSGAGEPAEERRRYLSVRITGRREGSVAILEVSDTGPGVPAKAREHLFEAFQSSGRPAAAGLDSRSPPNWSAPMAAASTRRRHHRRHLPHRYSLPPGGTAERAERAAKGVRAHAVIPGRCAASNPESMNV